MANNSNTNILSLPLASAEVITGTNEDWIDSFVYLAEDTLVQVDLRGIRFEMVIRRTPDDAEVILHASTDDNSLCFGAPPDRGYLIINVSHETMKIRAPGQYVGEIIAQDGIYQRRTILLDLTIVEGVARTVVEDIPQ